MNFIKTNLVDSPKVEILVLDNIGHYAHAEAPDKVLDAIYKFLQEISTNSTK